MKIYNFDHNYNSGIHWINDFKLNITSNHIENLNLLSKSRRRSEKFDCNFNPIVEYHEAQKGQIVETAEILDYCPKKSKLYPDVTPMKDVDDLCLVLSLLTGRYVISEHLLDSEFSLRKISSYLSPSSYMGKMDLNIDLIEQMDLAEPLYSLVLCGNSSELGAQAYYANAALNNIYEKWSVANKKSKFNKLSVKSLRESIANFIRKDIEVKVKSKILKLVENTDENYDLITGFKLREQPSAILKMTQFLESIGVLSPNRDAAADDRLKLLNRTRNSFVHAGSLPKIKDVTDFARIADVTSACIQITQFICIYYFLSEVLKIDDYQVEVLKSSIIDFFQHGKLNGMNVFGENFDEYLKRIDKEFIGKYGSLYAELTNDSTQS